VIDGTAEIWLERLQHFHPERLRLAFEAVEAHCKRWPTPAEIIECLPTYPHAWETPAPVERQIPPDREAGQRISDRAQRNRDRAHKAVADCAKMLDVTLPPGTIGAETCDPATAAELKAAGKLG
jgi:hypothetical protein